MTEESKDQEAFLERWSRRKLAQADGTAAPPQEPAPPPQKADAAAPAAPLPAIEGLTPESDFKPFMAANVDGATRRAALKKLFADAHFNVPDPFEAYSEDWTVGEKMTPEMIKGLQHAKRVLFDEAEKTAQAPSSDDAQPPAEQAEAAQPQPEAKDVAGKQDA